MNCGDKNDMEYSENEVQKSFTSPPRRRRSIFFEKRDSIGLLCLFAVRYKIAKWNIDFFRFIYNLHIVTG